MADRMASVLARSSPGALECCRHPSFLNRWRNRYRSLTDGQNVQSPDCSNVAISGLSKQVSRGTQGPCCFRSSTPPISA